MTKVLIIGSGGREHAIGWSIEQDHIVEEVIYAPGNPGTNLEKKGWNADIAVKKENFGKLADLVEKEDIDKIVVGSEQPLVDGIVDYFNGEGFHRIFGPTGEGAQIESDKFLSHTLMDELGIPEAKSLSCYNPIQAEEAIRKIATKKGVVIKARGLTGGKGVYVCDTAEEALSRLKEHTKAYGPEVLISERLFGQEFSVFGNSDGERVVPLEMSVQDHKQLEDNDKGPMTGGMGAYGPAPIADKDMVRHVADKMMTPLVKRMKEERNEFKGFLYAAVILTKEGPKILEYNCRFGDPEAQPAVMMLKNGLYQPISAALEGRLDKVNVAFKPGAACCVVMASKGYPDSKKIVNGFQIGGLDDVADLAGVKVFHAGTAMKDGKIVTSGGRVLGVTAYSPEGIADARNRAYIAVHIIDRATRKLNNGKEVFVYRNDIAAKALGR